MECFLQTVNLIVIYRIANWNFLFKPFIYLLAKNK